METEQMILPVGVVTRADVGRLMREAETVDSFMNQAAIREPGTPVQLPKTSRLLDETVSVNKLNLLQTADRKKLFDFLKAVRSEAPVLHMSFNSDPSPIFQQRLIAWVRQEMHPSLLLQIGLNPSIGAGCIVRTTNKFFDFSLRQRFYSRRETLVSLLMGAPSDDTPVPSEPAATVAEPQPNPESVATGGIPA